MYLGVKCISVARVDIGNLYFIVVPQKLQRYSYQTSSISTVNAELEAPVSDSASTVECSEVLMYMIQSIHEIIRYTPQPPKEFYECTMAVLLQGFQSAAF